MLSVVIPTRDRRHVLLSTLDSLASQGPLEQGYEVVVVDDGSSDGTAQAVRELAAAAPLELRFVAQPAGGPARARNAGVAAARGEVILFLGDDTAPADPGVLAAHARLHSATPDLRYAVQGRVTWDPREPVSPLMEWLERSRIQFGFDGLAGGSVPASTAFCTAHVSLKRELFERAGGFEERFPYAAVEDVELGTRLESLGARLDYHPDIVALHNHPTELSDSLDRLRRVGRSAALLHRIHPGSERRSEMGRPSGPRWSLLRLTAPAWKPLAAIAPGHLKEIPWRALHMSAYANGYRRGPPEPSVGDPERAG